MSHPLKDPFFEWNRFSFKANDPDALLFELQLDRHGIAYEKRQAGLFGNYLHFRVGEANQKKAQKIFTHLKSQQQGNYPKTRINIWWWLIFGLIILCCVAIHISLNQGN